MPSMQSVLGLRSPAPHKPRVVVQACNPSTEAGRPEVHDPPQLHIQFEASLAYVRPCLKRKKNMREEA